MAKGKTMKQIVREPLVHFLLLGAGLFMAYSLVSKPDSSDGLGKIIVTQGQIEHLVDGFTKAWQRPPTAEELAGLVQDRVREEVYCREAMAMGLDKDDTVIRRRLRQKLEFISEDIATMAEPTDADLNAYFQGHLDKFRIPQRFTFSQVYLNPEKHGENLTRDTVHLLAQLNQAGSKADISVLGDAFLLERQFSAVPDIEVAKQFGEKFVAKLSRLAPGQWQGPVESGYGIHLVLVSERTEGRLPGLAEVRASVRQEWANSQRLEANEKFYQNLLKRYTVTIERPESFEGGKKLTQAK
jgi:parvulin-like peptidyl-prolyl cis-trans isomerase-like protein